MSKKSKILLLTLAPLATAIMPVVTISCDWFKSPYPLKPTPIDPNKPSNPYKPPENNGKASQENTTPDFAKKLIYECPQLLASNNDYPGCETLYHYVVNIHNLKKRDVNGNETSEYEDASTKIARYKEAKQAIDKYIQSVNKAAPYMQDLFSELWKKNFGDIDKGKDEKKYPTFDQAFFNSWYADYQFFTESRIKDGSLKFNEKKNEYELIRELNQFGLNFFPTLMYFLKYSFSEINLTAKAMQDWCDYFIKIYETNFDENKTLKEQLLAFKDLQTELFDYRWLQKEQLGLEYLEGGKTKLAAYSPAMNESGYNPAYHFNKIAQDLNTFISPLSYLTEISKDGDDMIFNANNKRIDFVTKYLMGRYCENSKTQLETIKKYDKASAKTQLEKWLNSGAKQALKLKYSSLE